MTARDVDSAYATNSFALAATVEEKEQITNRSPEEVERRKARYDLFLEHDPDGAWVAVDGERVVGSAIALARDGLWILSLFAVDARHRNTGVGRELLQRALAYGDGCKGAMIASSTHPAAMRRYALAGFALRPTLTASGRVRRDALPAGLAVREGDEGDLDLVAEVDRRLRGAAHGPEIGFLLGTGARLLIAERPPGRGYALEEGGSPWLVAATRPEVAAGLLMSCLASVPEREEVEVRWITGSQTSWAVPVVLAAGLSLSPAGPICVRGETGPLAPYLPSGPYL